MTIFFQIGWALLCIAWNMGGKWMISQGGRPPGPTASWAAAGIVACFAIIFWMYRNNRRAIPYVIVSAVGALLAAYAVYGGFTQDKTFWPSEFWRWAGIILNVVGAIACLSSVLKKLQQLIN